MLRQFLTDLSILTSMEVDCGGSIPEIPLGLGVMYVLVYLQVTKTRLNNGLAR